MIYSKIKFDNYHLYGRLYKLFLYCGRGIKEITKLLLTQALLYSSYSILGFLWNKLMNTYKELNSSELKTIKPRLIFGVGINDIKATNAKRVRCPYYPIWYGMLARCYCPRTLIKNPTYYGCTICEDWLTFSKFKSWMETQDWEDKALDKDLLVLGNRNYSPDTCIFVSLSLNNLLNTHSKTRGLYPLGVSWHKGNKKFQAQCRTGATPNNLGYFNSVEEASKAYRLYKRAFILELASEQTDLRLKTALYTIAETYKP